MTVMPLERINPAALARFPHLEKFPGLAIWHKLDHEQYYAENSFRGIRHVHAHGANAIDGDGQLSRERIPLLTHWPEPIGEGHFHDPRHLIPAHAMTRHLKLRQIRRLVADPGGYRIHTLDQALKYGAHLGVAICYECKTDHWFEDPHTWAQIAYSARAHGAHVVAMTIQDLGGEAHAQRRLGAAHEAGVPTLLLTRGRVDWGRWAPVLDGYKGPHQNAAPDHIARLGTWHGDATMYGASCHDGTIDVTMHAIHQRLERAMRAA